MSTLGGNILEQLNDDMVSHGWLVQCAKKETTGDEPLRSKVTGVLQELLMSGHVEIGDARLVGSDHVGFTAWKGSVAQRVSRANETVERTMGPDKEFAYWLCLRRNVDRFEKGEVGRE